MMRTIESARDKLFDALEALLKAASAKNFHRFTEKRCQRLDDNYSEALEEYTAAVTGLVVDRLVQSDPRVRRNWRRRMARGMRKLKLFGGY